MSPQGRLLVATDVVAGYVPELDILNGCDLEVVEGELIGVIGPNGAGKSTLVKALFGLLELRRGTVTFRGEDISRCKPHELVGRGVGYVPQTENVFQSLTVQENLEMGSYLRPKGFASGFDTVTELFPLLAERRMQRAGSLSGGERQMLGMARAMMMQPDLLFLDEPSAGLAPMAQDLVFERVKDVNAAGVSIVMVEQNARRCLQICDRAYVLDQGRNAHTGRGLDLLHDQKVIELYLGTLARAE